MSDKSISEMRSEVIETFIGIEGCVASVIGIHYLGKLSLTFYHEVLYDEYFSFGLKVRILEKILDSDGNSDSKLMQKLRRLNNIRNLFAHCGVQRYDSTTKKTFVPNPRNPSTGLDFEALFEEFSYTVPEVGNFLLKTATGKGADIKIKKNGQWEQILPAE